VTFNFLELVTGTAAIANGTNAVSLPSTTVTIPGVSSVTTNISVIEAPITVGPRVGNSRTTKQVVVTITPTIGLNTGSIAGLNLASITGSLPITISGGVATGTLARVRCGADKGIDASVDVNAANITTSGTLNLSMSTTGSNAGVLGPLVGLLGTLGLGQTTATLAVNGTGVTTQVGTFEVPFDAPLNPDVAVPVGNTTLGLDDLTYGNSTLKLKVALLLGTASVDLGVNFAAIAALLDPVMAQIDTRLVQPLLEVLGLNVGGADVWPVSMQCGVPTLAG
jgi:uncharacterized membrane protein